MTQYKCPAGVKELKEMKKPDKHKGKHTPEQEQKEYMEYQAENFRMDPVHGPLHVHPYAGGHRFPKYETLTVKPGFKIWVDGGLIDYDLEICYTKMLDCSATCCLLSYCAPEKKDCINYKRRDWSELYFGAMVMTIILAGIPTCIKSCEYCLM